MVSLFFSPVAEKSTVRKLSFSSRGGPEEDGGSFAGAAAAEQSAWG